MSIATMTQNGQHPSVSTISADLDVFQQRLHGQCWRIAKRQSTLAHLAECFRDQPALLPLQCSEAVQELDALRRAMRSTYEFLSTLDPGMIQQVRPWACIDKLVMLDYLISEVILTIDMFASVCQVVTHQRVELHLFIRSLFPRVLATYQDTLRQLVVLVNQERQEVQR